ncbi:hypothetical protein LBMAG27_13850 [Bacteroidota bacterium]|nr:hypothetical protein LBMAG27_13850 [Bacteroidota bacterium]
MKSLIKIFTALLILLLSTIYLMGCKETCPEIDKSQPNRNVLIEEFTGVRCVNCPQGHQLAASLQESYPEGSVIVVAIHSGALAGPYPFGTHNFLTTHGSEIDAQIGPSGFWPSADINRKLFSGETERYLDKAKWPGYVAQELTGSDPKVRIEEEHQFNDTSRLLNLTVKLFYNETVNNNNNLSVMLTESGLIEPQLGQSGIDTFYVHRHVLRDMMTQSLGDPIDGTKDINHPLNISLPSFTIPASWNADSVHIVTFVTDTDSLNVLQVIENKLK